MSLPKGGEGAAYYSLYVCVDCSYNYKQDLLKRVHTFTNYHMRTNLREGVAL